MMSIIVHAVMAILLLCSMIGYFKLVGKKLKLLPEFIPVFVFSSIACFVYIGGIFNLLLPGAILVFLVGLISFAYFLSKTCLKKECIHFKITLFQGMFFVGSMFFLYLLSISKLTHYDNFSHWAIALKVMLSTNAFPTAASELIDFKNYPLGTTSFLYYICRFAGHSQAVMLIGQGLLIFACFYGIFGIIKEKKRFLLYGFLGAGCSVLSFFNITIRINNLLVDFILPIYTLVLFVIAYRYKDCMKKACVCTVPIAGLLMIVKNTGTIYAGIGLLFLVYQWLKNREKPLLKTGIMLLSSISASFLPYVLWSLHMAVSFQGVKNKFDVSTDTLNNASAGKSGEDINKIVTLFVKSALDINTRPALGVLAFHVAVILTMIFTITVLKKKWNLWKALIALDVVLISYYLGILALYIFSMPLDEAIRLAGFDRYASSIVVLFAGGLILCATVDIENTFYYRMNEVPDYRAFKTVESKDRYQKGVIGVIGVSMALLMSEYNGMYTIQKGYETTLPYEVKAVTGDRWYKKGDVDQSKYLFYASDRDSQVTNYYMQYLGKYMLYAPHVDGICAFYEDNMTNLLSGYDYLVMVESDAPAKYLLKKHYGVTGGEGIYKIIASGGEGAEKKVQLVPQT